MTALAPEVYRKSMKCEDIWVDPLVMDVYQCGLILTTVLLCWRIGRRFSVGSW